MLGVILVIMLAAFFYFSVRMPAPQGVACTADAMQCPDGSYVGRTGPNCQFVCPTATSTATTATSTGTGAPVAPSGDGTGVSDNFALGIDGTTELGSYLIAFNGQTVYTYAPDTDTPGKSSCTGTCATNWPPYIVPAGSRLNLEAGVAGTIGTIVRADGTAQITYKGQPLYFYIKDTMSGDTKGQGVGGVWYVVKP